MGYGQLECEAPDGCHPVAIVVVYIQCVIGIVTATGCQIGIIRIGRSVLVIEIGIVPFRLVIKLVLHLGFPIVIVECQHFRYVLEYDVAVSVF